MEDLQIITLVLVISGGLIIGLSALYTLKLLKIIRNNKYHPHWKFLLKLMVFLMVGYFIMAAILISGNVDYVHTVTGLIFFIGAVFVYLTVWAGKNTIEELLSTTVSKTYVENIIKSMADTLIVINADEDATIRTVNHATENLLGYNENELVGKPIEAIIDPALLEEARTKAINDKAGLIDVETTYKTKNGDEIPVSLSATKLSHSIDDVEGFIYVAKDIRERKEAERKIKLYLEQLKELNASKDRFFSIIAHDLRSPFSALLGYAELLANDAEELGRDEIKEFSSNLYGQSKSIYDLLENLLEWSRIQTGRMQYKPENISLSECLSNLMDIYKSLAEKKNIKLICNNGKDLKVYADENMLFTVLRNLTSNAIKFTNDGGSIFIDINPADDKYIEISVKDTGVGIPKDIQDELFEIDAHHSTKGTHNEEGTGLGLILCKELVKQNGGELKLKSEPDKGTTFSFTIPAAKE